MHVATSEHPDGQRERFAFGENWSRFLSTIDDDRIAEAERSLTDMLGRATLHGLSFLDVGCGSGLFSLAAVRLGADRVRSFDFDPASVACTAELRDRYAPEARWTVERGDVLDPIYMSSIGRFDVVYAWGVLHHTGDMSRAMEYTTRAVASHGLLFVSIYNDQGRRSERWRRIKRTYNRLPRLIRVPYACMVMAPSELRAAVVTSLRSGPKLYISGWRQYRRNRGMSRWHDFLDWVGGYPFEVARPEQVFDFYRHRGFILDRLTTCGGGTGCNQFVFRRPREPPP